MGKHWEVFRLTFSKFLKEWHDLGVIRTSHVLLEHTHLANSHRDSNLVEIWIDSVHRVARLPLERNMFVKSFVVGSASTLPLSKMELRAGSSATKRPAC